MIESSERARAQKVSAETVLRERFSSVEIQGSVSAQFVSMNENAPVAGIAGLPFSAPIIESVLQSAKLYGFFESIFRTGGSVLLIYSSVPMRAYAFADGAVVPVTMDEKLSISAKKLIEASFKWGGKLNDRGELICDPASPSPGPHYYTNLLLGNRMGFDRPLQSTPKSTVDRIGGGSFRSHADTQVLATRWDYLPDENGFPANRQFYLVEDGKQIFYSGSAVPELGGKVICKHSQNRTYIEHELSCGLAVRRTIFILPQEQGMPLAAEAQMIEIENRGASDRKLRIVYTGMFGTSEVHALRDDIIFTTVVAQSEVFYGKEKDIRAFSFNPNPTWTKGNIRYCTLMIHEKDRTVFPDQFCAKYSEFVGAGTLARPENLVRLSNRHARKGPGFFALSTPFSVAAGQSVRADHFACLSSDVVNVGFVEDVTVKQELSALLDLYSDRNTLPAKLQNVINFNRKYASHLQVRHPDKGFEAYVNHNLPFQVFYQTFVSRSFDWTQKGYREIGFREIQDVFASMYYFAGMGEIGFVRDLLREWAGNVYREGYANHNFYWKGKEPGWWSDDSLWLIQALDRYIQLTGDYDFLNETLPVAGEEGQTRKLSDTIKSIISYSGQVSVGKHGIPLIDRADWNDCLRMDPDCINGPDKIQKYRGQLTAAGMEYGSVPFESEYSESVMNGFLLKVAVDAAKGMFIALGDGVFAREMEQASQKLDDILNKHAWKNDFFARVLFNRKDKPNLKYLGADGDGLMVEEGANGTYFLNTFSWSILSRCASEEQIEKMLNSMDKYLRTPFGFRLCTGVDYPKIAPKIDVALYYPGDRENGGIFKHANMMAAAAMLSAARTVDDESLAERLTVTAYWVIDCILPYRTLKKPFETCGNPRLCTQYNNSETGENIGPTLSGTSTWLLLSLFMGLGIEFLSDLLILEPILRPEETECEYTVNTGKAQYQILVTKPSGFARCRGGVRVTCDGEEMSGTGIPIFNDGEIHTVVVCL